MARNEVQRIEEYLESMAKYARFTGAVMVARDGKTVFSKGYGKANATTSNKPSTVFHIGSLTKQFTAAAVIKLWEEGRIDLDAPIDKYLSRFYKDPSSNVWSKVTVQHLLSHTSGIPSYTDDDDYIDRCFDLTVDKIINEAREKPLQFKPGSDFEYCNTGYILLGKLIEVQSGMSYGDYIKRNIFIPAQMKSSGIHDEKYRRGENDAIGYTWDDDKDKFIEDNSENIPITSSDGALLSTVEDMVKWNEVLNGDNPEVLNAKAIKMMTTPKAGEYGCGLFIDKECGQKRIHHNGSIAGFTSDFYRFPNSDTCIIVLCNNSFFSADRITYDISSILFEPKEFIPLAIPFPRNFDYSPYLQLFYLEDGDEEFSFELDQRENLYFNSPDEDRLGCMYLTNDCIFSPTENYEFELNDDGTITMYCEDDEDLLVPVDERHERGGGRREESIVPEAISMFGKVFDSLKGFWRS